MLGQRRRLVCQLPVNTTHLYNIYTMLDQRLCRWPNIIIQCRKCELYLCLPPPPPHSSRWSTTSDRSTPYHVEIWLYKPWRPTGFLNLKS